jgi:hypothetical protein
MIIASRAHASRFLDKNWQFQLKNFSALGKPIADLLRQSAKPQRNCLAQDLRKQNGNSDYVIYTKNVAWHR